MNSIYVHRLRFGVLSWLILASVTAACGADADSSGDVEKRKAAIAAILQAGGDIRVEVSQFTVDRLERLPISKVDLRKAKVENALIFHIGNLKELKRLDLSAANIDDEGLKSIAHLPLRELWLQSTHITDASATTISKMKTLNFLQLNATKLSDDFLEQLAAMPNLEDLGLRGTLVTGEGMQHLSRHPKLKKLDVYHTAVDDAGVDSLSQCKSLTSLGLSMTKITNRVFHHLTSLPNLTNVDLSANPNIRSGLVKAFEEAYPNCDIEWYGK